MDVDTTFGRSKFLFIDNSRFWAHASAGARVSAHTGANEVNMRSRWSLMGWFWRSVGVFLMGYKNFEVPERVDSHNSTKIIKVRKF